MLSFTPSWRTAVFFARIVMPFSRSRSIESMTRSATSWFSRNAPDCHSMASTSVVLPWSTWAMIATLRMFSIWAMKFRQPMRLPPATRAPVRKPGSVAPVMGGQIVVGYDGSTCADSALDAAISLGRELDSELVLTFGFEPSPMGGETGPHRQALHEFGDEVV